MNFIKNFKNINKNDVALAGGKGASLGEMTQVGFSIPPGFVILSTAFEKFIKELDLNIEIDSILHTVNPKKMHTIENASEKIKSLILNAKIPKDIILEIKKEFKKLNCKYVAVRSSATSEDSLTAAWAGQLESYLNTTEKDLLEKVKHCWASLFTPRAIFYRFEKNLHKQKISIAVVVQKMIASEKSGIAFSVHPVTQDKNQLIIEAGYGLGEAIVSGQITPDSYVVEKKPLRIIDKNIQVQTKGLYRAKNGGNEWREIPQKQKEKQVLSDREILKLSEIILKIENHYGFPCDIEWAFEKEKFYIVQSRPITTLLKIETSEVYEILKNFLNNFEQFDLVVRREFNYVPFISIGALEGYKFIYEFSASKFSLIIYIYINGLLYSFRKKGKWELFLKNLYETIIKKRNEFKKILKEGAISLKKLELFLKENSNPNKKEFVKFLNLYKNFSKYYMFAWLAGESFLKEIPAFLKKEDIRNLEILRGSDLFTSSLEKFFNSFIPYLKTKSNFKVNILNYFFPEEIKLIIDQKKDFSDLFNNPEISYLNLVIQDNKLLYIRSKSISEEALFLIKAKDKQEKQKLKLFKKINGQSAFGGIVRGCVKIVLSKKDFKKIKNGDIIVTQMTTPEFVPLLDKVIAIITDEGGITCHAAIISRELKKPCIIGTKIATKVLKDGDLVEVDANNGVVKILKSKNKKTS